MFGRHPEASFGKAPPDSPNLKNLLNSKYSIYLKGLRSIRQSVGASRRLSRD